MRELGLNTETEHYFNLVPWQSLAAMNHNFLLTERRRHYLRYLGGLTFFEVGAHTDVSRSCHPCPCDPLQATDNKAMSQGSTSTIM